MRGRVGVVALLLLSSCANESDRQPAQKPASISADDARWCTTALSQIDWQADPERVLKDYEASSTDCSEMLRGNSQLAGLALLSYALLQKDLPLRPRAKEPKERTEQLIEAGIDQQAAVTYASRGLCEDATPGVGLMRIAFKKGALERFAGGSESTLRRLASMGGEARELEGGQAVTFAPDPGKRCSTTLFLGEDELIVVQAGDAGSVEELVREARQRTAARSQAASQGSVVVSLAGHARQALFLGGRS